ncbi:MAG TPA: CorA family divalent cation transporter [Gemmatimonadales bacterium]|nr:CorA family divalent cation transporter [Gemmatimonadales bacterium]
MSEQIVFQTEQPPFHWLDVTGPAPAELADVASRYHLHPLMVQDSLEPDHLPKFERAGDAQFVIVRAYDELCSPHAASVQALTRKVAIFVGPDYLITVHRKDQPFLARLRDEYAGRPATDGAAIKTRLFADIVNAAVNSYEAPLDAAERELEQFERTLFHQRDLVPVLREILVVKRRVGVVKRMLAHTINAFVRIPTPADSNGIVVQDLRENLDAMFTWSDELLEELDTLLNLQLGLASHRTNQTMRMLTVVSAFFLPLTFIVGIYGMNFRHMPELEQPWGYPAALLLCMLVALGIGIWFRRQGWLKR